MKINFVFFFILTIFLFNCSKEEDPVLQGNFKFISNYSAEVTVGGVVGITEKSFEVGEIHEGTDNGGETINIRIAEHSELNENCPNSWCYQEFLDVPREFLKFVE